MFSSDLCTNLLQEIRK